MGKDERDILKENIKKFIKSAEIVYNTGDFTSSAIINKYDCDKIKNDVERIIKEQGIFEDN